MELLPKNLEPPGYVQETEQTTQKEGSGEVEAVSLEGLWKLAELHVGQEVWVPRSWWPEGDSPPTRTEGGDVLCVVMRYEPYHFKAARGAFIICTSDASPKEYAISEIEYASFKAAKPAAAEGTLVVAAALPNALGGDAREAASSNSKLAGKPVDSAPDTSVKNATVKARGKASGGTYCGICCAPESDEEDVEETGKAKQKAGQEHGTVQDELEALRVGLAVKPRPALSRVLASSESTPNSVNLLTYLISNSDGDNRHAVAEIDAYKGRRSLAMALCRGLCNCGKGIFVCIHDIVRTIPVFSIALVIISLIGTTMVTEGLKDLEDALEKLGFSENIMSTFVFVFILYFLFHVLILLMSFMSSGRVRECCFSCLPACCVLAWRFINGLVMVLSYILYWLLFVLWMGVIILLGVWSLAYAVCLGSDETIHSFDEYVMPAMKSYAEDEFNVDNIDTGVIDDYCEHITNDTMKSLQQAAGGVGIVLGAHSLLMLIAVADYYLAVMERAVQKLRNKAKGIYRKAFESNTKIEHAISEIVSEPPKKQEMPDHTDTVAV
ncbi:hypothetical protein CYMTET_6831 [Cymbomonas tetramitiformis]|uniref:Uncharacterized protein n=1 Tax=Cymbomonas tetramitiformis TaxID=36881 RepID=A0AAE0LHH9_9CHLO|nr:hypothetical protein CYMTET_6831 [Cymbomonas tetramitiformis]